MRLEGLMAKMHLPSMRRGRLRLEGHGLVREVLAVALERAERAEADAALAAVHVAAALDVHRQVLLHHEALAAARAREGLLALEVAAQIVLLRLVLGAERLAAVLACDRLRARRVDLVGRQVEGEETTCMGVGG